MEKWKDIPNTNGNYSASTLGRIKSNDKYLTYLDGRKYFVKGRILTPCKMSSGYLKITTSNNLEKKQLSVSRIVATLFIPNPNKLKCVCHKNDNRTDNCIDNLFWGSHKDNTYDMIKKGRKIVGGRKLNLIQVSEIKALLNNKQSQQKIADAYHVSQAIISDINTNKSYQKYL